MRGAVIGTVARFGASAQFHARSGPVLRDDRSYDRVSPGQLQQHIIVRTAALLSDLTGPPDADPRLRANGFGGPPGHHPGHPTACGGLPSSEPGLLLELMTLAVSVALGEQRRVRSGGRLNPGGARVRTVGGAEVINPQARRFFLQTTAAGSAGGRKINKADGSSPSTPAAESEVRLYQT